MSPAIPSIIFGGRVVVIFEIVSAVSNGDKRGMFAIILQDMIVFNILGFVRFLNRLSFVFLAT